MKVPRPFLKWPGGKGRIAARVTQRLPEKIGTYYEPLLGGGAVFIELAKAGRVRRAVLSDASSELINAWRVVQRSVDELVSELRSGKYVYDKEVFYKVRDFSVPDLSPVERAARMIYLNRTCFNGLYRVNLEGKFNSPFGKYENPLICDEPNLRAVSALLTQTELSCSDFERAVGRCVTGGSPGDAVYFDPPYIPLSKTSSFTAYTEGRFSLDDHRRIAALMRGMAGRGVRCVVSNSSSPDSLSLFPEPDFEVDFLVGTRSVGGPAEYRGSVREIIASIGPA